MTKKILAICLGLILVFGPAGNARGGYQAEIEDLSDRDYFPRAIKAIKEAKESIWMVMYLVSLPGNDAESEVSRLVAELVKARQRGVKVKIILDCRKTERVEEGQVSYRAYKVLKGAGIEVYFDNPIVYTHNKTLVIDRKVIIAGSANWSNAALNKSNETSFLIICPPLAERLIARFKRIKLLEKDNRNSAQDLFIPYVLMKTNGVFSEMLRRHDKTGFDIYLNLLKLYGRRDDGKIDVSYQQMAAWLGIAEEMDRIGYRRKLNRILRRLDRTYKVIRFMPRFNRPLEIVMLNPDDREQVYDYKKLSGFGLPLKYWGQGWDKRLGLAAKFLLLVNFAELGGEHAGIEWMMGQKQIQDKYGISGDAVSGGLSGLRSYNVIEIQYGKIDKGYEERLPAAIRYLGLYDLAALREKFKELGEKAGPEKTAAARKYAGIIFKDYDYDVVSKIVEFMETYGEEQVKEAFAIVAQKAVDNPKRTFRYVIGILKKKSNKNSADTGGIVISRG